MGKHTKANGKRKRGKRGMGRLFKKQGSKQLPADSPAAGTYYLTYTVNGERKTEALRDRDSNPITDRKAAEAARKKILAPFTTGDRVETLKSVQAALSGAEGEHAKAVEEANPPLRIADAWQAFCMAPKKREPSDVTLSQYEGHWKRFCGWLAQTRPNAEFLRDVTPDVAEAYAQVLIGDGLSPNRYNKHRDFLKRLCDTLKKRARITENPFAEIVRRELETHSRRELTIPELTTILDLADGDLALLLYLGACTGLRLGDCATLQWGEVDLARGIIRRIPNKTARSGKPVLLGIPSALHERLSEVKGDTGYILPAMAETYHRDAPCITNRVKAHILDCGIDVHAPGTGQRIKRKPDGSPERNGDSKVITEDTGQPAVVDVGFHSLRHTWVSMHAERGTPQAVIQASVGHANPAMTRHYTHISEGTARDTALALPVFAGSYPKPRREPLPAWAEDMVKGMTAKNWKAVRDGLLKEASQCQTH